MNDISAPSEQSIRFENGQFVPNDVEIENTINIPTTGPHFHEVLNTHQLNLVHDKPNELQMNLGKLCNLACHHCHVDAGPKRTEIMSWEVMEKILVWAKAAKIERADLTGGAPELNPDFRKFCDALIEMGYSDHLALQYHRAVRARPRRLSSMVSRP